MKKCLRIDSYSRGRGALPRLGNQGPLRKAEADVVNVGERTARDAMTRPLLVGKCL